MAIKTDACCLTMAKSIIGLTGQNQDLQSLTGKTPR